MRIKAEIVAQDEKDQSGIRAHLNFGHSFAHAIETEAGIRHGEAVAIGMALAYRFAAARGDCPVADATRVVAHLAAAGLPVGADKMDAGRLVAVMAHDKKAVSSRLRLILPRRIGTVFAAEVAPDEVEAFLTPA